jgi:hypothetical protein
MKTTLILLYLVVSLVSQMNNMNNINQFQPNYGYYNNRNDFVMNQEFYGDDEFNPSNVNYYEDFNNENTLNFQQLNQDLEQFHNNIIQRNQIYQPQENSENKPILRTSPEDTNILQETTMPVTPETLIPNKKISIQTTTPTKTQEVKSYKEVFSKNFFDTFTTINSRCGSICHVSIVSVIVLLLGGILMTFLLSICIWSQREKKQVILKHGEHNESWI